MLISPTTIATVLALSTVGWKSTGLRWNTNQLPIPYCITTNATNTNVSAANQRTAIVAGINAWVSTNLGGGISCTTYAAAASSQSCLTTVDGNDQRFNIFFEDQWQHGSSTIGVTWATGSGGGCGNVTDDTGQQQRLGCKFDSDIEFNNVDFFWTTTGQGGTDIASIATHEYGHFIGLDHCNDNGTCAFGSGVMYAAYPGGAVRVPFADDIQGACALYPGTPGGLGWPCASSGTCTSNICVNPSAAGYCTQTCGACPQGYACGPNPQNPGQSVCLRDDGLNRGLCEVCQQGLPGACMGSGVCLTGFPEPSGGRCTMPCPTPSAPDGACPNQYTCIQVQFQGGRTESHCIPKSYNCADLSSFTELAIGQQCNGNPACASGLTCIGICSTQCTGAPGQGSCPSGYACESFNFQSGAESFCAPPVNEGQNCEGIKACTAGPCLLSGNNIATCYQDCANNSAACNNAQQCDTFNLQNGGTVSICEPPGVPPRPDAGVAPDSGVTLDVGPGNPGDGGTPDDGDGGTDRGADAVSTPCFCDTTTGCEANCACDPECGCDCDLTLGCDPNCSRCDPECLNTSDCAGPECANCGCTTVASEVGGDTLHGIAMMIMLGAAAFPAMLTVRRRLRRRGLR